MAKYIWQARVFNGSPLFAATTATQVTVIDRSDDSLAEIWSDIDGNTVKANPFYISEIGKLFFYADEGRYKITATNGSDSDEWDNELLGPKTDSGGGGGGGGQVDSIVEGNGIEVDDTDPENPVISSDFTAGSTSSGYTLSAANRYQWMTINGVSTKDITVPLDSSFNPGDKFIHIFTNLGAGTLTIVKDDPGVELIAPPGGSTIIPQNATVGLKKASGVSDTYIIFGVTEAV